MNNFIRRVIKSMGVLTVLKEYKVESFLTYYRMDFRDKYDNYIVFDIFYNETDIFTTDLKYIGSGRDYSLSDGIRSRCKIIGSLTDYLAYRKELPSKEILDEHFKKHAHNLVENIVKIKVADFHIRRVDFYTSPTLMLFVHISYKTKRVPPIKIFIGEEITYSGGIDVDLLLSKIREVLYV